jgi:hypothetical protein
MTESKKLLNFIESATEETRGYSILQLAYMLERSNMEYKNHPEYLEILSAEQLKVILSPDEQDDVVREILRLIDNKSIFSSSLMWAAGKATPNAIVSLVHEYVLSHYTEMDDGLLYQSVIAVQNGFAAIGETVPANFKFADLQAMFEVLAHSQDERISYQAKHTVQSLQHYKEEGYW